MNQNCASWSRKVLSSNHTVACCSIKHKRSARSAGLLIKEDKSFGRVNNDTLCHRSRCGSSLGIKNTQLLAFLRYNYDCTILRSVNSTIRVLLISMIAIRCDWTSRPNNGAIRSVLKLRVSAMSQILCLFAKSVHNSLYTAIIKRARSTLSVPYRFGLYIILQPINGS